ncbi:MULTISPECIES: cupin domain-containing protein [unclassified Cryobacterium]|uniref:cupin domain-containing protein n=1 Tax=unclassified Cryobacterium TaxID=2649013 RepID=UPI001D0BF397|nr:MULTISPECIES: cupin domain-containing protein [unclassified Cryobacterium]
MESDTVLTFVEDLLTTAPVPAEGMSHNTVLSDGGVRVVMLSFAEGHVLKDHAAPGQLLMQAVDGELKVRVAREELILKPGGLISLAAKTRHEVEAVTDARLMLTLVTR